MQKHAQVPDATRSIFLPGLCQEREWSGRPANLRPVPSTRAAMYSHLATDGGKPFRRAGHPWSGWEERSLFASACIRGFLLRVVRMPVMNLSGRVQPIHLSSVDLVKPSSAMTSEGCHPEIHGRRVLSQEASTYRMRNVRK